MRDDLRLQPPLHGSAWQPLPTGFIVLAWNGRYSQPGLQSAATAGLFGLYQVAQQQAASQLHRIRLRQRMLFGNGPYRWN